MHGDLVSHTIEENVVMLTIACFIFARLHLSCGYLKDETCDFVKVLKDAAAERESEVSDKEEILRQAMLEVINRITEIEEESRTVSEAELFSAFAKDLKKSPSDSDDDKEASDKTNVIESEEDQNKDKTNKEDVSEEPNDISESTSQAKEESEDGAINGNDIFQSEQSTEITEAD